MALSSLPLMLLLFQAPDEGWGPARVQPGDVKRIYWELLQTTEVLVRLIPADAAGKPVRVNLVFQAFFPRTRRAEPVLGAAAVAEGPANPTGRDGAGLCVDVHRSGVLAAPRARRWAVDLTGPGSRYRQIPCLGATDHCTPNGVEVDLDPAILRSLITARSVDGQALGFPITLTQEDQAVPADFATRIGLSAKAAPSK